MFGNKKHLCPLQIRDKGVIYLCGTTLVPVSRHFTALERAQIRRSLHTHMGFGALLRGDMSRFCIAASHQMAAL